MGLWWLNFVSILHSVAGRRILYRLQRICSPNNFLLNDVGIVLHQHSDLVVSRISKFEYSCCYFIIVGIVTLYYNLFYVNSNFSINVYDFDNLFE